MIRATRQVLTALVVLIALTAAAAHEFWIQPGDYRPAVGGLTELRLMVGDGLPGERKPRDAKKVERFEVILPQDEGVKGAAVAIDAKDGAEPAGAFTARKPGVHAAVYRGKESVLTLEAAKFEAYLLEEGLDDALKQRRERMETAAAGREAYSRCAKALFCVGGEQSGQWDVRAGLAVEIVPVSNPYAAHAGDTMAFVLLREGKPVTGAKVAAITLVDGKSVAQTARSDAAGKVSFVLKQPGLWVLSAVVMDRVDAKAGRKDVDWISIWSSLSFDLAKADPPTDR